MNKKKKILQNSTALWKEWRRVYKLYSNVRWNKGILFHFRVKTSRDEIVTVKLNPAMENQIHKFTFLLKSTRNSSFWFSHRTRELSILSTILFYDFKRESETSVSFQEESCPTFSLFPSGEGSSLYCYFDDGNVVEIWMEWATSSYI